MSIWTDWWLRLFGVKNQAQTTSNNTNGIEAPTARPVPDLVVENSELLRLLISAGRPRQRQIYDPKQRPVPDARSDWLVRRLYSLGDEALLCAWYGDKLLPGVLVRYVIDLEATRVVGGRQLVYRCNYLASPAYTYGVSISQESLRSAIVILLEMGLVSSVPPEKIMVDLQAPIKCTETYEEKSDGGLLRRVVWGLDLSAV